MLFIHSHNKDRIAISLLSEPPPQLPHISRLSQAPVLTLHFASNEERDIFLRNITAANISYLCSLHSPAPQKRTQPKTTNSP